MLSGRRSRRLRPRLNLSRFVRQAALQASARIEEKVTVREKTPEPSPFVLLEAEPVRRHMVDGEWVER